MGTSKCLVTHIYQNIFLFRVHQEKETQGETTEGEKISFHRLIFMWTVPLSDSSHVVPNPSDFLSMERKRWILEKYTSYFQYSESEWELSNESQMTKNTTEVSLNCPFNVWTISHIIVTHTKLLFGFRIRNTLNIVHKSYVQCFFLNGAFYILILIQCNCMQSSE